MTTSRRRRSSSATSADGSDNHLLGVAAVRAAVQRAQHTMGLIVQDARDFRFQSNSSLQSIGDKALRESVGARSRHDRSSVVSRADDVSYGDLSGTTR